MHQLRGAAGTGVGQLEEVFQNAAERSSLRRRVDSRLVRVADIQ